MPDAPMRKLLAAAVAAGLLHGACAPAGTHLVKPVAAESQRDLAAGEFLKAIEANRLALQKYPGNMHLAANYARTVEDIKRTADQAFSRQEYALAEKVYGLLLDDFASFKPIVPALSFKKGDLEAGLRHCRVAVVDSQARRELAAGNYAKALSFYPPVFREYPGDADLAARYMRTVEDVKAAGDRALAEKDLAQAGRIYALLLQNFPSFEGRQPAVAFARKDLEARLAGCRDELTKTGLAEYRKGNLARAVAVWEGLLEFDPDNAEIRKAVETAKTQMNEIIKKKSTVR